MFLSVCSGIFQIKTLRHLHIQLNRTALPCSSDGVFQMEVNLRTIECAVAFIDNIVKSQIFKRASKTICCDFPIFIASHGIFRTGGKFYMIFKSKEIINFINQSGYTFNLLANLILCHKDMGIILCKAAHTHQTMKLTGFFMAVYKSQFTDTERQVFIGMRFGFINQHTARAVHRFYRKICIINNCRIHIVFIVIPVTGIFPQMTA